MTDIHLGGIKVQKDKIILFCEKYSSEIDDYISYPDYEITSKELINDFNLLDLENREKVLEYISNLENHINYDELENMLLEQEQKNIKEKELIEEMEIEYE